MKKQLLSLLLCLGAMSIGAKAQTLIHYWHFNNLVATFNNPNIPPFKADYSVIDTNKALIVYSLDPGTSPTYAGYIDPVGGDTINARMGQPAGNGLRVRNPSDSMTLLFYIPTTNYKNIHLKYEVEASSLTSGMLQEVYDYSTDSGATWKTTGLNMLSDSMATTWKLETLSFGADTTVNNNGQLVFRITFAGNTSLTSGNNRFDNVTVEGDTLTATTDTSNAVVSVKNNAGVCSLYPNPATDNITINTASADAKTITIYNIAGQKVYADERSQRVMVIPVAKMTPGMYYVLVHNKQSGENYTLKFVKQ